MRSAAELQALWSEHLELRDGVVCRRPQPQGKMSDRLWRSWSERYANKPVAIGPHNRGYATIRVSKKLYLAHRVIFFLHHGWLPEMIDHINGDKRDNRIENLRAADPSINGKNQRLRRDNTSGVPGVSYSKRLNRWRARITIDRRNITLGAFRRKEDAIAARLNAQVAHGYTARHGTIAHPGIARVEHQPSGRA